MFSPPVSPRKTADDNIAKEDMNTIEEYREVHEEDDTQSAPLTATKVSTIVTTTIKKVKTHPQETTKEKVQNWKGTSNKKARQAVLQGL